MSRGQHSIRKIALVEPKTSATTFYSGVGIPRQGAVLLGTILAQRGHEVQVQIEEVQPLDWSGLVSADLVGISTITPTAPRSYALADALRRAGIPVVLGGVHVTFLPEEGLDHADFVVRGEGEDTIVELVRALEGGGDLQRIRGLSFHANGEKVHNPDRPLECDLDRYPVPDFSLVRGMRPGGVVSILTRRGCPFDCSFCCVAPFNGRRPRETSVERVLSEIEQQLPRIGAAGVLFFADDIFNLRPARMKRILRGMIENRLTPLWVAQVRHEAGRDPELLDLMRRSNCFRVFVGFESVNPRTLEAYGKDETVEDIVRSIHGFRRARIKVHGMFVAGSDEDTVQTVRETTRFAIAHDLDSMQINVLTPLPGSRLFQEMRSQPARLLAVPWTLYDGGHVVHVPRRMSPSVLQDAVTKAVIRFYSWKGIGQRLRRRDLAEAAIRLHLWWSLRQSAREFKAYSRWLKSLCGVPAVPLATEPSGLLDPPTAQAHTEWGRAPGCGVSGWRRRLSAFGRWLRAGGGLRARLGSRLGSNRGLRLARFAHLPGAVRASRESLRRGVGGVSRLRRLGAPPDAPTRRIAASASSAAPRGASKGSEPPLRPRRKPPDQGRSGGRGRARGRSLQYRRVKAPVS